MGKIRRQNVNSVKNNLLSPVSYMFTRLKPVTRVDH